MIKQVVIKYRVGPCTCGCKGEDPWHLKKYTRNIHNIKNSAGQATVTAHHGPWDVRREGVAQLPWGKTRVVEIAAPNGHLKGWYIDRDSMLDVMEP